MKKYRSSKTDFVRAFCRAGTLVLVSMWLVQSTSVALASPSVAEHSTSIRHDKLVAVGPGTPGRKGKRTRKQLGAHQDPCVQIAVVHTTVRIGDKILPLKLTGCLGQLSPIGHGQGAKHAVPTGNRTGTPPSRILAQAFSRALSDRDQAVRIAAVRALRRLGPAAFPLLIKASRAKDPTVRRYAIQALPAIAVAIHKQ